MNHPDTVPSGNTETRGKQFVDTEYPRPDLYGDELRRLLKDNDLSQKELARRAGVDQTSISMAATATRRLSPDRQSKVVRALGLAEKPGEPRKDVSPEASTAPSSTADQPLRFVAGQHQKVDYPEGGSLRHSGSGGTNGAREGAGGIVEVKGVRNYRALKQLGQSELARRAGLSAQTVQQAEKKGTATRKTARMLAGALGVSLEELAKTQQRSRFGPERPSSTPSSADGPSSSPSGAGDSASHKPEGSGLLTKVGSYTDPSGSSQPVVDLSSLKEIRASRGLSQAALARQAGLGQPSVGRTERKGRAGLETARRLAWVLSVSLEDLAGSTDSALSEAGSGHRTIACEGQRISSAGTEPGDEAECGPLRIEVSEEVLKRVDRVLGLLESLLGRRRS